MAAYAHPEVLVENDWLATHLQDPKVRVAEVDYDPAANYELGHIPGSVLFDWRKDINDPVRRDILSQEAVTELFRRAGIDDDTTVVLYGDFNNWFAAFAFWVFTYYGAKNLKLLNGGRKKWIAEDRPLTKDAPKAAKGTFQAHAADPKLRAFLEDVRATLPHVNSGKANLVDVRGPKEFSGRSPLRPSTPPSTPSAEGTSPARRTSPGPRPSTTRTGPSSPGRTSRRFTSR
ncbi:MAG: sulfurtransferase, partial [Thermoplasmata archaeon]